MQNTGTRIVWDEFNNCELKFECPELPEALRKVVEETIAENALRCLDPKRAKGNCLRMTDELMLNMAATGKRPFVDCHIIHARKPHPHFWLLVDGWHIDLTARQFDSSEACPKIWKNEGFNSSNLHFVRKGKGSVLFQLVPVNNESYFYSKIYEPLISLKAKQRKLVALIAKKANEAFSYFPRRESSFGGGRGGYCN